MTDTIIIKSYDNIKKNVDKFISNLDSNKDNNINNHKFSNLFNNLDKIKFIHNKLFEIANEIEYIYETNTNLEYINKYFDLIKLLKLQNKNYTYDYNKNVFDNINHLISNNENITNIKYNEIEKILDNRNIIWNRISFLSKKITLEFNELVNDFKLNYNFDKFVKYEKIFFPIFTSNYLTEEVFNYYYNYDKIFLIYFFNNNLDNIKKFTDYIDKLPEQDSDFIQNLNEKLITDKYINKYYELKNKLPEKYENNINFLLNLYNIYGNKKDSIYLFSKIILYYKNNNLNNELNNFLIDFFNSLNTNICDYFEHLEFIKNTDQTYFNNINYKNAIYIMILASKNIDYELNIDYAVNFDYTVLKDIIKNLHNINTYDAKILYRLHILKKYPYNDYDALFQLNLDQVFQNSNIELKEYYNNFISNKYKNSNFYVSDDIFNLFINNINDIYEDKFNNANGICIIKYLFKYTLIDVLNYNNNDNNDINDINLIVNTIYNTDFTTLIKKNLISLYKNCRFIYLNKKIVPKNILSIKKCFNLN